MSGIVHPLVRILADGKFHSGPQLGEALGISRAAVWKHVDKISSLGIEVHSVRGKGYRLEEPLDLLDREAMARFLPAADSEIQRLEILGSIDSTNTHAMRQIQDESLALLPGQYAVFLAEQQTRGKGRRGRQWASPFGQNLYLTMARQVDASAMTTDGLSLVIGLALARALKTIGVEGVGVKWPNDLIYQGRKLAGILLEITGDITGVCQLLVGVGVNIRCRPESMSEVTQPWTDLYQITGKVMDRNQLAGTVVSRIIEVLGEFEQQGMAGFLEEWHSLDVMKDRDVELVTGSGKRYGKALGITETGALRLETDSGVEVVSGGEISLRSVDTA